MYRQIEIPISCILNLVTKLWESAIVPNTNYMKRRLFRRETIIINNLARSLAIGIAKQ